MTRRRLTALALTALALMLATVAALAYWTTSGSGNASASIGTLKPATISVPASSSGQVEIRLTEQASLLPDPGKDGDITYAVERKPASGGYAPIADGPCAGAIPHGTSSCADTVTVSGDYSYRVVARYHHSWTATSNDAAVSVTLPVPGADLSTSVSVSPESPVVGQVAELVVDFRNAGPAMAHNVSLSIDTGDWFYVQHLSTDPMTRCWTWLAGLVLCNIQSLAPGVSGWVSIVGGYPAFWPGGTQTVEVGSSSSDFDPDLSNNGATTTFTVRPAAPTLASTTARNPSDGQTVGDIELASSTVESAHHYNVYRSTSSSGPYVKIGETTSGSYTDPGSGLAGGTTYHYYVTTITSAGTESPPSNERSATAIVRPKAPTLGSATARTPTGSQTVGDIQLSLTAVTGADHYNVYRSTAAGGPYEKIGEATGVSYTDRGSGLTGGTTYDYVLTAVGPSGAESDHSNERSATAIARPEAPTLDSATATAPTGSQVVGDIQLAFTTVTGTDHYNVYRSAISGGPYSKIGQAGSGSYTDPGTGLSGDTTSTYYYVVTAVDSGGTESLNSNQRQATEIARSGAPTLTSATAQEPPGGYGVGSIWLAFTTVTGADHYNVYRSASAGGPYDKVGQAADGSYTDPGSGLSGGTTYHYVVTAVTSGGVESFYSSERSATVIAGLYRYALKWSGLSPFGVAVDSSGSVWVADTNNHRIRKFNASGSFLTGWGGLGSGDGQFASPGGVAVDSSGNVYVADTSNHRIQKFNASGGFLTKWGGVGSGNGQFASPQGVAVDSSGNVYVADTNNHRIQKFDASGGFLIGWGGSGSANGQFDYPYGVAVDSSGNVYVADGNHNRIQEFDASGSFTTKWGSYGTGDGQFASPHGVAVDSSGNVYVADTYNNRIQKFEPIEP